ncbi:MAG: KEOPS complex kinase/ATPase Bud32 [Candidatus Aenigmatarchaeota archaeon]
MEIIYRGAESIIYLDDFEGQRVVVKERIKKSYRIKQIDEKLRKLRTRKEAKLLTEARKCNVATPKILDVDEKNHKIIMEFIDGMRIKEFLENYSEKDIKDIKTIFVEIGKSIGKLHSNKIIHGDITTSNMILRDSKIYFIDFGLGEFSNRIEDMAVDLNLLYEALRATHYKILDFAWQFIIKGYKEEYKDAEKVLKQMEEIEKRARYMERS